MMAGTHTHSLVAGCLADEAARCIVQTQGAAGLREAVVLVPGAHAVAAMARALRAAAGASVVLLPQITTLRLWADGVDVGRPVQARSVREAVLYGALAGHDSLGDADRWAVCGELLQLFDELTRHDIALPRDARDFARLVEQAYRARANRSLDFEASLVHELWRLATRDARELDAESAYTQRLALLAEIATAPLYVVSPRRLTRAEETFLERYAQRAPVTRFTPNEFSREGVAATLAAAWPTVATPVLHARARALRQVVPECALAGRVSLHGAPDAEAEARAVDVQVRDWLLGGRQRIAVVALDRVTARRARALLERAGVLVRDESGWPMATTSAATVLSRWLDVVSGDVWHRDLLDLLKSPFAFHDWPRETRQQAVWRLERYVRKENVLCGIGNFIAVAEAHDDAEVRQLLVRVQRAIQALPRARKSLARWLAQLQESLREIGVMAGWRADSAGVQVIDFIDKLSAELADNTLNLPFAEWRRWLTRQLEAQSFVESAVASPVVFTHLAATPLRSFDAVLVLGCDARHLGGATDVPVFFNQAVRAQLGLPTRQDDARETEALLAGLIATTPRVMLTWQTHSGAEENLLAPPLERLRALLRCAYDDDHFSETRLSVLLAQNTLRSADENIPTVPVTCVSAPEPIAERALLPARLSASAYNALMACPYQFRARYMLGVGALEEAEELLDKSGFGRHVHAVLTAFHRAHASVDAIDNAVAVAELVALSDKAFADAVARNALARGWLMRWKSLIPAYVEWQRAREADGWRWIAGEAPRERVMRTPQGHSVTLVGRLDRVDQHDNGAIAMLDYKTRSAEALKKSLETPGEDVQLPFYVLLWSDVGEAAGEALYVALERDGVVTVDVPGDVRQAAHATQERLGLLVDQLQAGAALPAQGAPQSCEYCEMQGLCRLGHWP